MRALLLFLNAGLLFLAVTSLMIFFTGGSGQAVIALLLLLGAPFSTLCALAAAGLAVRESGWSGMKARILANIPNWLKFGLSLSLALLFCGELALLLAQHLGGGSAPRYMYLPIVSGTLASLAFALVYSRRPE